MVPVMTDAPGAFGWHVRNNPEVSVIAKSLLTLFVREVMVGV
jgi:hypothetical protein